MPSPPFPSPFPRCRLFLLGLTKFGKGDWRSISRNFVISRTPTQVASHAQKYFIRLNSLNRKDKRRTSIHDITGGARVATPQAPTDCCRLGLVCMHRQDARGRAGSCSARG